MKQQIIVETPFQITCFIDYFENALRTTLTTEDKSDIVDVVFRVINGIAFNLTNDVVTDILTEVLTLDVFMSFDIDIHGTNLVTLVDNVTTELFTMLNELELIGKTINVLKYTRTNLTLEIY